LILKSPTRTSTGPTSMELHPILTPPVIHDRPVFACTALTSQSRWDSAASSVTDEEACRAVPVIRANP